MINCVPAEHLNMTLYGSIHVVLILNQSIKASVALMTEHVKGLHILLVFMQEDANNKIQGELFIVNHSDSYNGTSN
jgi:hypothetical protein